MSEMMISSGSVKTVINNKVVQDKEYALKHDGEKMNFGVKDGVRGKLVFGKLNNKELNELLLNKNDKSSLKDNLEKLLPNKNIKKKRRGTKKKRKKKPNVTLKIEEKKKRKNKTKRKRKKNSKSNRLKDFFNFLN